VHASFRALYAQLLVDELARAEKKCQAMPGVHALIAELQARGRSTLGLLTGNYRETGSLKLEAAGLAARSFSVAAWGDMAATRPDLVPVAVSQVGRPVHARDVVVIGDTVRDVQCARDNGAFCIAVATGGGTRDELSAAGADVVLDSLADTAAVLALLDQ
jgi:phosphoglycolate phosphatase-like HAD superfamily hydrolase